MRKNIILIMIFVLFIMLSSCNGKNNETTGTFTDNSEFLYNVSNGYITIQGIKEEYSDKTEITIPQKIEVDKDLWREVKYIGESAFSGNTNIIKLNISINLYKINDSAFLNATNLKEINFVDSEGNKSEEIAKNSKLEEIGENAFKNTNIENIIFPSGLRKIGNYAFMNSKLKNIKFNLKDDGINFGNRIFEGCELESVENENGRFILEDGLLIYDHALLYASDKLENIELPDRVLVIMAEVFYGANIKSINLNKVNYILDAAFAYSKIEEITGGDEVSLVSEDAFYETKILKEDHAKLILAYMLIVDNIDTDTYVMDDVNTIYLVKGNARRIILPKYLRTVISNALYDIEGLEEIYFTGIYAPSLMSTNAFNPSAKLIVPYNSLNSYKNSYSSLEFTTKDINISFYKGEELVSTVEAHYGDFLYNSIVDNYKSVKDKDGNVYNKADILYFTDDINLYLYEKEVTI